MGLEFRKDLAGQSISDPHGISQGSGTGGSISRMTSLLHAGIWCSLVSLSPHHGAPSSRPLHVVWAPQQQGGLGVATPLMWRKEVETSRPVKGCYWNQQGIISSRFYWSKGSQHLARLSGGAGGGAKQTTSSDGVTRTSCRRAREVGVLLWPSLENKVCQSNYFTTLGITHTFPWLIHASIQQIISEWGQ